MDSDAQDLTLEGLEKALLEMIGDPEKVFGIKPTKIIIHPEAYKDVMRVLYWKPPIRKARGMRARKRALYWRAQK